MFKALKSDELPAGEGAGTQIRRVRTDDGHVMVARLTDGRLVAFAPSCPHQVTPLDDATLHDGVMRCPRHGYQYDACTGVNVFPTRDAKPENLWKLKPKYLPVYDVEERDGWIWVSTDAKPPPDSWDPGLEERPAGAADEPVAASPITRGAAGRRGAVDEVRHRHRGRGARDPGRGHARPRLRVAVGAGGRPADDRRQPVRGGRHALPAGAPGRPGARARPPSPAPTRR